MKAKKRPFPQNQPAYATSLADAPTELYIPPPAKPQRRGWKYILVAGLFVGLFGLAVLLLGGLALLYYSDWVLPGVSTLEIDLGGQTTDEAAVLLADQWQQRTITLAAENSNWTVSPAELGITLDTAVTSQRAHDYGRSPDSLWQWLQAGGQAQVAPAWQIDLAAAEANLNNLAGQFAIAPQDASVIWDGSRFQATPPVDGRALDVPSTIAWLEQSAAQAVMSRRLELPTTAVTPAITDVSALVAEANRLLDTAVTIHAYDPIQDETLNWTIASEQWGQWLRPVVDPVAPGQFDWSLDEQAAQQFLAAQPVGDGRYVAAAELVTAVTEAIKTGETAVPTRIYHHPRQHIVQSGETFASIGRAYGLPYPWIQQANPGVSDLFVGQALTIPSPDEMLPLPVIANKRIIVSISQQRVWAYENGTLKWEWPASTGIADSPTSPGVFQVQTHETNAYAGNWDLWMPYFMSIYQPVPTSDFMNGFHGFPTRDGQNLLWTSSLGHQVTYGCVLISTTNAQQLFEWAEAGVVVEIRP